jgi:hypothetical protein
MTKLDQNMQTRLEKLYQVATTSSVAEFERPVLKANQDLARTALETLASFQPTREGSVSDRPSGSIRTGMV